LQEWIALLQDLKKDVLQVGITTVDEALNKVTQLNDFKIGFIESQKKFHDYVHSSNSTFHEVYECFAKNRYRPIHLEVHDQAIGEFLADLKW